MPDGKTATIVGFSHDRNGILLYDIRQDLKLSDGNTVTILRCHDINGTPIYYTDQYILGKTLWNDEKGLYLLFI